MSEVLESAGVVVVGAQGRVSPSAGEFAMAADGTHAREIVILPSSSGIRGAAELAATALRDQGVTVAVIPTRSIVQTLAAVAVHDPGALFSDDVVSMTRAATATHYGGVSISTRDAMTTAGRCVVGDVLGIIEGDVVEIGGSVNEVADRLLHRMLAVGGDLVTVVEGEGAPTDFVADVLNRVRREHPGIEIIRYSGGQPVWPLIIGVE
jgi:dihydroxyacetone kinase-like predicted kinase